MNKLQEWLLTKQYQAQGWSERKAEKVIGKMSIHDMSKLYLLTIRAIGVVKARQELITGFEKEFANAVKENANVTTEELTDKYFAEKRFLELLSKLSLTQHDIKELAHRAIG